VVRTAERDDDRGERADLARAFVDEVTWYMSEHKISRADLAQSMGVSAGRVSQILSAEENLTCAPFPEWSTLSGPNLRSACTRSMDRWKSPETTGSSVRR